MYPPPNTHTTLACSRAEWLLLLPGLCCNMCLYPSTNTRSPSLFRFSLYPRLRFSLLSVSSQDKATPLHQAAVRGHGEVVKALLAAGSNAHASTDVSGEEGRLDYRDGALYMRGGVGIKGAGPHVPSPPKHAHNPCVFAC